METSWQITSDLKNLAQVAKKIKSCLLQDNGSFTLWLIGDLGAGKTTIIREILSSLGLPKRIHVVSPTFTYVNEYKIGKNWYAHLDLYRLGQGLSLENLGVLDGREFAGIFVEWPDKIGSNEYLRATYQLNIEISSDQNQRSYFFSRVER